MSCPVVVLLSGKRFSGKDTVAADLLSICLEDYRIATFASANELKRLYCEQNHLDFQRFLTDRMYKESHHVAMTEFYHMQALKTPFEQTVAQKIAENAKHIDVAIVTDWRFERQFQFLKEALPKSPCLRVRIEASDKVRKERGWIENSTIDAGDTETALDNAEFDITLQNNSNTMQELTNVLRQQLLPLLQSLVENQKTN